MLNIITSVILSVMAVKSFNDAVDKKVKEDIQNIVDVAENELKWQGYKDGFKDGVKDALFGKDNKFGEV